MEFAAQTPKGGYCFVPLESSELMHWLLTTNLTDGELTESEELRILRQTVSHISSFQVANESEVRKLEGEISLTCKQTIANLWTENRITVSNVRILSDWVWNFMMPTAFLGREHYDLSTYSTTIGERILAANSIPAVAYAYSVARTSQSVH